MKCPKCGETMHVSRTLEGVVSDLNHHVGTMMAHIRVALAASPENPVDRHYELGQVEAAARATVHVVRALGIIKEAFEGDPP